MPFDLTQQSERKRLIKEIVLNEENLSQKRESLKQFEIQQDRLHQYVTEYLEGQFDKDTVKEMPVMSSVNVQKRVVTQEASIYRTAPERSFTGISDEQVEAKENIYHDMKFDTMMLRANQMYKMQNNQVHIGLFPKNGKFNFRIYLRHHIDAIPDPHDPEKAVGYVLSVFDSQRWLRDRREEWPTGSAKTSGHPYRQSDRVNQGIADPDDAEDLKGQFVVWTKPYMIDDEEIPGLNMVFNEQGVIISDPETTENPLSEVDPDLLPIINLADNKGTFEYWIRQGQSTTEFTIQWNAFLTDMAFVSRMQGWSQGIVKGPKDLLPSAMKVGPNKIIRLVQDPDSGVSTDFSFVSPNPDLSGMIQVGEMILSNWLTSKGIDTSAIATKPGGQVFGTATERLLASIEKFEASREDIALFENAETQLSHLVDVWSNLSKGNDLLDEKYRTSDFPEDSDVSVMYHKPEMIQTREQKIMQHERERDLGLVSRIDGIMERHNMTRDEAVEKARQIDEEEMMLRPEPINNPFINNQDQEEDGNRESETNQE